jgi:tRNA (guanine37-N1)-methyltransferase
MNPLVIGIISIFPELFGALNEGIVGRAFRDGIATLTISNPREYGKGRYRRVDDTPFGGGAGMVMMLDPLLNALNHLKSTLLTSPKVIYLSPQGKTVTQTMLNTIVEHRTPLIFVCGRYEGIDQRFITHCVDEEWSIGDFVTSGGELPAMVFIDALVRLIPTALGNALSSSEDSFMNGLLDYPHYTKPSTHSLDNVPDVLMSGHHNAIARYRRQQALGMTWLKKRSLLNDVMLSTDDKALLDEFIASIEELNHE